MKPATTAILTLLLLAASLLYGQSQVDGEWTAFLTLPLGEVMFTMNIIQKGEKLSGYMLNDTGQYDLEGNVTGDRITARWSFPDDGKLVAVTFTGRVSGNSMSGAAKVGAVGEGSMSAQRK